MTDAPSTPRLAEEPTGEEWQMWHSSKKDVDKMSERELRRELKYRRKEQEDLGDLKDLCDKNHNKRELLRNIRYQINDLIGR